LYPSMFFGIERREGSQQSEYFAVNNVYLNGVRIAAVNSECRALFYHTDQVDSVKVVTDDLGLPVTHSEYLPYGELLAQEGNECNREQFNSQAKDKESGLYYFNARHYDAGIARFVTADTVVDGEYSLAGWNRYMYCGGNPVLYKDPSGHSVIGGIIILAVWLIIDDMIDPSGEIADDE